MAAVLLKARPKVPVSFEDVSVYFTKTEWKLLDVQQRILYKTVMLENYHHLVSLGFLSTKPHLVSWLEQGEGPWTADIWRTPATADTQTGDCGIQTGTSVSAQKRGPEELPGPDRRTGDDRPVAWPSGDAPEQGVRRAPSPPRVGQERVPGRQGARGAEKRYVCPQCGRAFSRSSNLIKHQVIHSGEKPYACGECGKLFRRSFALLEHRRTHSGERPYACGDCGKAFTRSSNLIKHQVIHSGEKPYACPECGKPFRRRFALLEHRRTHSGERPYACGDCGKAFRRSSNLIEHQRTHRGDKPYACGQCAKAFKGVSQLIHHQRSHSGDRPFTCKQCGKAFRGCSGLSQHQRAHSGERPYACPDCGRAFSRRANLCKHRALHRRDRPYARQQPARRLLPPSCLAAPGPLPATPPPCHPSTSCLLFPARGSGPGQLCKHFPRLLRLPGCWK
uniref:ZFP92 zinc finger protein n=1 Tax=Neovison vison TaxID=452646 RepID=A0A8C7C520_NEOVI